MRLFGKSPEERYQVYRDIDVLPIGIWFEVNKTKDIKKLIISGNPPYKYVDDCYFNIMDQYVKIFGISDSYKELLELKKKLRLAEIDFALTGNRVLLNHVNMYKFQLKALENIPETKEDEYRLIASVQKYTGLNIDPLKFSTRLFFSHVVMAQEEYDKAQLRKKQNDG